MDERTKKLKKFILKYARQNDVEEDANIFEMGFANSLFAIQLIMFVEKEFAVSVENSIFGTDDFNSISSIRRYIESRLTA